MKKFWLLPLAALSLLVACAGNTPAARQEVNLDTATWVSYGSPDGDFTLKLPQEWTMSFQSPSEMRFDVADAGVFIVAKEESARGATVAAHLSGLDAFRASLTDGVVAEESPSEVEVVVDDATGILREENLPLAGLKQMSAYVLRNGKAYTFTMYTNDGRLPGPSDETVFHYLLSTVDFPPLP